MIKLIRNALALIEVVTKLVAVATGLCGAILIVTDLIPVPSSKTVAIFAFLAFAGACLSMKTIGDEPCEREKTE